MPDAPIATLELRAPAPAPPAEPTGARPGSGERSWSGPAALALPGVAALLLALDLGADHAGGLGGLVPAGLAGLVLFAVCGDALALALLPAAWRPVRWGLAAALGAASSGLVLTVLGFAHIPLRVSLWLTLAAGVAASVVVRRIRRRVPVQHVEHRGWRGQAMTWAAALVIVGCVALIPAFISGSDTIYGNNPDAHQVVGIALLFQHVAPAGTDNTLPIDTVPPSWRFRYSIFYPLAAASNLSHLDPIKVFPAMAALLVVLAALGFALLAVDRLGAPVAFGPAIAALLGLAWVPLYLAWHPYWNQLWGLALLPYALLFGWRAAVGRDRPAAALFVLMVIALALAYPLAVPYPLVIVGTLALAHGRRARRPRLGGRRQWALAVVGFLLLGPAFAGAAYKLSEGLGQLFSAHSALWSGDITHLTPVGNFAGTGSGALPALAVLVVAALGLSTLPLPRRSAVALGLTLAVLLAVDLRFRLVHGGGYMDFKHLSYVGMVVLAVAAAALARWVASGSRRVMAVGALLGCAWITVAVLQDRREARATGEQVTPQLLAIRGWARRLPLGASVRVDIPPSGEQLWAVYMLGSHPVDAPLPLFGTTYARAAYGLRADYSLAPRYLPSSDARVHRPAPPLLFAQEPPLFENEQYVLRRIVWPAGSGRYARVHDTSSTALIEP